MLEIKNLLFQPLVLHLADSTKSIHLKSRGKTAIKDKDLSQEIKKAQNIRMDIDKRNWQSADC